MKNTLKTVLAVMSLSLVLTACGSKSEGTAEGDSTAVEAPAPEAPAADTTTADTTAL